MYIVYLIAHNERTHTPNIAIPFI